MKFCTQEIYHYLSRKIYIFFAALGAVCGGGRLSVKVSGFRFKVPGLKRRAKLQFRIGNSILKPLAGADGSDNSAAPFS